MLAEAYLPVLMMIALGLLLAGVFTIAGILLGPKLKDNKVKFTPFESGHMIEGGMGTNRYDAKFYMIALVFLIFDVEIVFLYPWAVQVVELGWIGFIAATVFLLFLTLGILYDWKKGALEWE